MRCRTRGSSANRTICWISRLPPSSAGCALPAMTICTGRSGSSSSAVSRCRVAQHQRQPLVGRHPPGEADGQHVRRRVRSSIQLSSASLSAALLPRGAQPPPGLGDQPGPQRRGGSPRAAPRRRPRRAPRPAILGQLLRHRGVLRRPAGQARTSRATQVGACTPLVIEPIGTSAASNPGHRPANISRLTSPCSRLTPLTRWASRMPITAMLNTRGSPPGKVSAPSASTRSQRQRGVGRGPGEVPLDQVTAEPVDAGGHRGVGGEHRAGPAQLQRLVEAEPLLDVLADALQAEEAGVALVGVEHLGLGVPGHRAERPDRPDAADAEQQLLAQPVIAAAAVQPVGDLAQARARSPRRRSRAAAAAPGRPGPARSARPAACPRPAPR